MAAARTAKTSRKKAAKSTRAKKTTTKRKASAAKATTKRAFAKKVVKKKAAPKPKTPAIETLARKIVKAAQDASAFSIEALYDEAARSFESGDSEPVVGHEGLRQKLAHWEEMLGEATTQWTPRNVFTKRNTICIEWDVVIKTESGNEVRFPEIAIHEVKGGKIAEERYYYDRAVLDALAPASSTIKSMPSAAILDEPTGTQPDPSDL